MLKGVAIRNEVHVAFFEDDQSGWGFKAVPGDELGGGKIISIDFDGVQISFKGAARKVLFGESISGETPATEDHASAGSSSEGTSSGDDILERMRKRRQKELHP